MLGYYRRRREKASDDAPLLFLRHLPKGVLFILLILRLGSNGRVDW